MLPWCDGNIGGSELAPPPSDMIGGIPPACTIGHIGGAGAQRVSSRHSAPLYRGSVCAACSRATSERAGARKSGVQSGRRRSACVRRAPAGPATGWNPLGELRLRIDRATSQSSQERDIGGKPAEWVVCTRAPGGWSCASQGSDAEGEKEVETDWGCVQGARSPDESSSSIIADADVLAPPPRQLEPLPLLMAMGAEPLLLEVPAFAGGGSAAPFSYRASTWFSPCASCSLSESKEEMQQQQQRTHSKSAPALRREKMQATHDWSARGRLRLPGHRQAAARPAVLLATHHFRSCPS